MLHSVKGKAVFGVRVVGRVWFEVLHAVGLHVAAVHVQGHGEGLEGSLDARGTVHEFRGRVGPLHWHRCVDVGRLCLGCISAGDGD